MIATVKSIAETAGGNLTLPVLMDIGDMWLSLEPEHVKLADGRQFVVLKPVSLPAPWENREWLEAKLKELS